MGCEWNRIANAIRESFQVSNIRATLLVKCAECAFLGSPGADRFWTERVLSVSGIVVRDDWDRWRHVEVAWVPSQVQVWLLRASQVGHTYPTCRSSGTPMLDFLELLTDKLYKSLTQLQRFELG